MVPVTAWIFPLRSAQQSSAANAAVPGGLSPHSAMAVYTFFSGIVDVERSRGAGEEPRKVLTDHRVRLVRGDAGLEHVADLVEKLHVAVPLVETLHLACERCP